MATGALLLKAPTAAVSRGSETPKLASKNSFACEQGPRWNSRGEGAGFGGVKISRKCTALAAPRASTMTTVVAPPPAVTEDCKECTVKLRTTKGCGLGVSRYPDFVYNAEGGGGTGKAVKMEDGRWRVQFDIAEVKIPDVGFHTTTLFGIPLPPPIRIQIVPDSLEGVVDLETGKVELTFKARFYFSTGALYRPPPLVVDTLLTTESTQGVFRGGTGSRLDADGNCKLAGVARLAPINDWFMDTFLMLPSDCLANMAANITFTL